MSKRKRRSRRLFTEHLETRQMLTSLVSGQERVATIPARGSDTYSMDVTAGHTIRVATGELSPYEAEPSVAVYLPSGELQQADSGNENAEIQFVAPVSGEYQIVVRDGANDESMHYRIRAASLAPSQQFIQDRDATLANGEEFLSSFPLGSFNLHPFTVSANETVRVSVGEILDEFDAMEGEPNLEVFDEAGVSIQHTSGDDDAEVQFVAQTGGVYTAVVRDGSNDEPLHYRIRATTLEGTQQLIANRDATLANGEEFLSSFPLGSFNLHPFSVSANETVRVSVGEILDEFDAMEGEPNLEIFDAAGISIQHTSGDDDAEVQFVAQTGGVYTAVVRDGSNDEPLHYRVRATTLEGTQQLIANRDATLANGEEFLSSFPLGSFNLHPFTVSANETVRVSVGEILDEFDAMEGEPNLEVFDAAGISVQHTSGNDDAEVQFIAQTAGVYTAVVRDGSNDEPLHYRVRATTLEGTQQLIANRDATLTNGEEFLSSFPLGSFNLHPFSVSANETVRVSVGEILDEFDAMEGEPNLEVFDAAGISIQHTSGNDDAEVQFVAQTGGVYTAVVRDGSNDEPLHYRVRATTLKGTQQLIADRDATLANGEEFLSSFPLGSFNLHPFTVSANETVRVSVGEILDEFGAMDGEPNLEVFDAAGISVQHTSGNDDAEVQFVAQTGGVYTAVVRDGSNDEPLHYRVRATTLKGTQQLIPNRDATLANGEEFLSSFPLGSFNLHPFTVSANETVRVSVGELLDEFGAMAGEPNLEVFDAAGISVQHTSGNDDAEVQFVAQTAGVYTAVVRDGSNDEPLHYRITVFGATDTSDTLAPRVIDVQINSLESDPADLAKGPAPSSWQLQRSSVRSLTVRFNEPVSATPGDFVLTNLGINAPVDNDIAISLIDDHFNFSGQEIQLEFAAGELEEGIYQLDILDTLTDLAGNSLGEVFSFGGKAADRFYVLPAELNGDEGVSVFDFSTFSYWFGTAVPTAPEYADLNLDGGVSVFDFTTFSSNFGLGVVYPGQTALQSAKSTAATDDAAVESQRARASMSPSSFTIPKPQPRGLASLEANRDTLETTANPAALDEFMAALSVSDSVLSDVLSDLADLF